MGPIAPGLALPTATLKEHSDLKETTRIQLTEQLVPIIEVDIATGVAASQTTTELVKTLAR